MTKPEYAFRVFETHFGRVNFQRKKGNFVALELGPGDSLFSAILAYSFGAGRCYMVDAGAFAALDKKPYDSLVKFIRDEGVYVNIEAEFTVPDLIENCGGVYYTEGLKSLKTIPDQSVDFIWSQAVLEHIRYHEFEETMIELKRVMRKDGVCSHRIDFKDHLGGGANNLRFGSRLWEADWIASSGFYTNRIRFKEMITIFKNCGFDTQILHKDKWSQAPISIEKLAREFCGIDSENLLISGLDIILKPID